MGWMGVCVDGWVDECVVGWPGVHVDEWVCGWVSVWLDGCVDGWVCGWVGCVYCVDGWVWCVLNPKILNANVTWPRTQTPPSRRGKGLVTIRHPT